MNNILRLRMLIKKDLYAALAILLIISAGSFADSNIHYRTLLPYGSILENGKKLPKDHYLGSIDSPIIMIEYASFSCIHCAIFSKEILPLIKKQYIDTGKVLFVFREFPLDKAALKASILARCYASNKYIDNTSPEQLKYDYFAMYSALFDSVSHWSVANNISDKLKEISKIGNMTKYTFDKCMSDTDIQEEIINSKIYAIRNLKINSTPVFLINGKKYEGIMDFESFSRIFDDFINKNDK